MSGSPLAGQRVKRDSVLAQDTVDVQDALHATTPPASCSSVHRLAAGGQGTSVPCPMALSPPQAWCGVIGWSRSISSRAPPPHPGPSP